MPSRTQKRAQPSPSVRLLGSVNEVLDAVKPEDYTIRHIQLALTGLKADQVPDPAGDNHDKNIEATAIACFRIVLTAILNCRKKPSMKAALVDLVIESREGICSWIHWLYEGAIQSFVDADDASKSEKIRKGSLYHASLLLNTINLDPKVAYAFVETPAFLDILFSVWTTTDPYAPRELTFVVDYEQPHGDSILNLLRRFVYVFVARDALIEKATTTNIILFAAATTGRAVQIREAISAEGRCSPAMISYAKDLIDFLGRILTSQDPQLRWGLMESNYLTQYGHLLYDMAAVLQRAGPGRKSLRELAQPAYYLAVILSREKSRVDRNWADLIAGKYEAALSFITANLKSDDVESKNMVTQALLAMGAYTVFPSVLKQLLPARADQNTEEMIKAQETMDVGIHWKEFWISTYARGHLYEEFAEGGAFDICDNASCDGTSRTPNTKSMQCSRCSSVVYCSLRCQRLDWIRFHRSECLHARKEHFEQRDSGSWYSHSSRAFHLMHLESLYTKHFAQVEQARGHEPPNTFISTIDCTTAKDRIEIYRVKNKKASVWEGSRSEYPQEYLKPRLDALGEEYLSGSMDRDMRLVEGVFPHGPSSEINLPVLLRKVGDRFEAVYSIPRRGIRGEDVESDSDT